MPEVRTFRGTIAGSPNALVIALIDEQGKLTAAITDRRITHNVYSRVDNFDVSSQLTSPVAAAPMPAQTIRAPKSGRPGTPTVGFQVPTGNSPNGVPYGGFVEFEVGLDFSVAAYNRGGQNVNSAVAKAEYAAMLCEHMLARDALIRVVYTVIVLRKENFYSSDPGAMNTSAVATEWNKQPLSNYRWDNICGSDGFSAGGGIGRSARGVAAGAAYHELTHLFGAGHWNYQVDTMGANQVSEGPLTSDRIFATRRNAIDDGIFTVGQPYPDPLPPYTYVDIVRTTVGTPINVNVLANDFDGNGDNLSVSDFTTTTESGGSVALNSDGSLRYTPPTGFFGKDIIVYTAKDDSPMGLMTKDVVHIEVVNNGLVAHFPFDETSGTEGANTVVADQKAFLNGANFSTHSVPSPLNRGIRVTGREDRNDIDDAIWSGVILGNKNVFPSDLYPRSEGFYTPFDENFNHYSGPYDPMNGSYTFSTWFLADDFDDEAFVASKIWHPEQHFGWYIQATGGKLSFHWRLFYASSRQEITGGPTLVPGRWYHTAVVLDRAANSIRLYLDGNEIATRTDAFDGNGILFNGRAPLCVGALGRDKYSIDDSRVYTKALTSSEVNALHQQPGTTLRRLNSATISVAAHLGLPMKALNLLPLIFAAENDTVSFVRQSGPTWLTVSADGLVSGTPPTSASSGTTNAVIRATGTTGQTVDIPITISVVDLQLANRTLCHWNFSEGVGTTAFDLSGKGNNASLQGAANWIRLNGGNFGLQTSANSNNFAQASAVNTSSGFTILAWIRPGATPAGGIISQLNSFVFRIDGDQAILTTMGSGGLAHSSGNIGISGNAWQQVAVSFKPGAANGARFYLNGQLRASRNAAPAPPQNTNSLLIGKSAHSTTQGFNGVIGEIKVLGFAIEDDAIINGLYSIGGTKPELILKRELYPGISGNNISNLTSAASFPSSPASVDFLTASDFSNVGADTGARISGWLVAATTGSYFLYTAADDSSELWLSTDANPANKSLRARNTSATGNEAWTQTSAQKSTAINLVAGRAYYIEALLKNGAGANHWGIGIQQTSGGAITLIPGTMLSKSRPDLSWDTSTTTGIQGGAGSWNTSTASWTFGDGSAIQPWVNGLNGVATFGGTVGQVTLNQTATIGGLRFLSGGQTGYQISGPGELNFGSLRGLIDTSTLANGNNLSTNIDVRLSGTGGLRILANGEQSNSGSSSDTSLRLNGVNTSLSGGLTVESGLITAGNDQAFGGNVVTLQGGGISATASRTLANALFLPTGSTGVLRSYSGRTLTINGTVSGSGALRKTDGGTVVLAGACSYTGDTTVSAGVLRLNSPSLANVAAVRIFGNGKLDLPHGQTDQVDELFVDGVAKPGGIYSSANSIFITGSGKLNVVNIAGKAGYNSWLSNSEIPLEAEGTEEGASYDESGVANMIQYLLGGDPVDPTKNGIQQVFSDSSGGNSGAVMTIAVPAGTTFSGSPSPVATVSGITFRIEGSTDLGQWNVEVIEVPVRGAESISVPAGYELKSFRLQSDGGSEHSVGFLRVHATAGSAND